MSFTLTGLAPEAISSFDTIIDVRSPSEYAEDHVPGAINLPVLDDEERARVGTVYVRESRFRARKIGAALVSRNAARHLEGPLAEFDGGWRPLVYCWRGGQRSGSFGIILSQVGWRVEVLEGGYRSYRRQVVEMLHDRPLPHRFVILEGNTGTAKTELLHRLAARGRQAIDLEGLAAHRGSLFGHVAEPQPAQKMFESRLAAELARMDPLRPVLLEAESSRIGEVTVPPSLWAAMQAAPRIKIAADLPERARYLVSAYADVVEDRERLARVLDNLTRLCGREQVASWQKLAADGAFERLAFELMERHYDPRYAKSASRFAGNIRETVALGPLDGQGLDGAAAAIDAAVTRIAG